MIWKQIQNFFMVPPDIKEAYDESCLRRNKTTFFVVSLIIYVVEAFNIIRVLFMSPSGLTTLNNWIYFYLYCSLVALATAYLVFQHLFRNRSTTFQRRMHYIGITLFMIWHICLSTYDLMRNPNAEIYEFTTTILGVAVLLYLSNWFSVSCIGLSYLAFMFFNHSVLSPGTKVNLTITVGVSLMIALVQSHHNVVELTQRQEINKINRQLETLLEQDRMLGILNKSAFEYRLKNALELVDASNHISALMLDLDDFKNINDRYGHPCGDYVLLETARTLKEIFSREDQLIGRIGGDEFAVLQLHSASQEQLIGQVERFLEKISRIRWNGISLNLGCSIGILQVKRHGLTYEQLYQEVDELLYLVKRENKGRYQIRVLE